MIITIETKLELSSQQTLEVDGCLAVFSYYYRKAWSLFNNKQKPINEVRQFLTNTKELSSDQCDSIINKVQTDHKKIKELTKTQLNDLDSKINTINKFIISESKKIEANNIKIESCKNKKSINYREITKLTNSNLIKNKVIWQKKKKLERLIKRQKVLNKRIETGIFSLCFGSKKLLKQNPNHISRTHCLTKEQTVFKSKESWNSEWELSRNNIYFSIGRSRQLYGNSSIQFNPNSNSLKIRMIDKIYKSRLKDYCVANKLDFLEVSNAGNTKYGSIRNKLKTVTISNVGFTDKNQNKIRAAISENLPITSKIIKKRNRDGYINYYLQCSFNEPETEILNNSNYVLGIDLNNDGLAYSIAKEDGNRLNKLVNNIKPFGYKKWDLANKTSEQRHWIISNKIDEVLEVAKAFNIPNIAIENLDFSKLINQMNAGYKKEQKFNSMLSQFARTTFSELLIRKAKRLGFVINLVNPANSSIGGYTKYGTINKLPVDIAASIWLARQALFGIIYKTDNNVLYRKIYIEGIRFPFVMDLKQSNICKKIDPQKLKWNHVSFALGKNRAQWYQNFKSNILPCVVEPLFPDDYYPFNRLENSY